MKLSELIKHLQEIEQDFIKHEVDVIIVNKYLILRKVIVYADGYCEGAFITGIEVE
jgi:hypothetical protein